MKSKENLEKEISQNRIYSTIPNNMRLSKEAEEILEFFAYQFDYENSEDVIELLLRYNNAHVNEILDELGVEFKSDF